MTAGDGPPGSPDVHCSVVIPVGRDLSGLDEALAGYGERLAGLGSSFEAVLVVDEGQASDGRRLAARHDWVSVCTISGGEWGRAVRAGLRAARGDVLCYTNWERTSASALVQMLEYSLGQPQIVFRANRRTRDTFAQRVGSLLFNLECRALLGIGAWDVNGTPKVFGRRHARLLELRRDDDLIDAEFAVVCEREGYSVAEIPIEADLAHGHGRAPDYRAAWRRYIGIVMLRRTMTG